jgi:hypothetical protein
VTLLGTRETSWVPVVTVGFLNNERLAVTWVARANATPTPTNLHESNAAVPFRLRAAVIDVSTGKILTTREWPSRSRAAGIVAANDAGFVVETGGELTLISPDLMPIKRTALPACAASGHSSEDDWYPNASWSGEHVLLISGAFGSSGCWLWVDTGKLQILASWQDDRTGPVAVSDDRLVLEPFGRHFGDPLSPLKVASPGGDWNSIPSTEGASAPEFVGPDLIYFQRPRTIDHPAPTEAFLVRPDGSEVFRFQTTDEGWEPGRVLVSRADNRLVNPIAELKGSHPALDIGGHSVLKGLILYDAPFQTPSYILGVRDSRVKNPLTALSPDGRHLAALSHPDPLLEVFALPPVK